MLPAGAQIYLRLGPESHDAYGRLLAHVFDSTGNNLAVSMLTAGLAFAVAIPPNLRYVDCYAARAEAARRAVTGVWRHPGWQPVAVRDAALPGRGFQRITGTVTTVQRGGGATWIDLDGRLVIKIPDPYRSTFPAGFFRRLPGRSVDAHGWIYRVQQQPRMRIHHPAEFGLSE